MSRPTRDWDSIPAMAAATAERFGDRLAVVDGDTRLSYRELLDEAERFAAALVASGLEPGDRVAIWAFNSVEWVIAILGLLQAGGTLIPLNTRFKGLEAAELLSRSRARVLITVSGFLGADYVGMLDATGVALPHLQTIVLARGEASERAESWGGFLARATPAAHAEAVRRGRTVAASAPSDIVFTSGTTGIPKGVVMTHGRTLRASTDWVALTGLGADDRYLMINPYFHIFGLKAGILASVASGAAMFPEPVFDVDRALRRIAEEQITVLPGPPTLYQSILDHPGRTQYDLSTLRVAVTGAADIPVELMRRVHTELPFSIIISGYGLTEAGTATATAPDDDVETIATTVGRPRPGFEVRIVDDTDQELPAGQAGEILLRGGSVMLHYLDDPDATAKTLSADGWLRTGDLGILDDAGCLRIVGRIKDMFIVGGFNVYPAEIENSLLQHPDIRQAAVIGLPDHRLGEVGMAFVVRAPGATASGAEIVEWCRSRMANYKAPRVVQMVDELPLNATGKVMKDTLRERAIAGRAESAG